MGTLMRMALAIVLVGCTQRAAEVSGPPDRGAAMTAPQPSSQLTLVVDATYALSMGYGHVWRATVRRVVEGSLPDHDIDLSLFDNLEGTKYAGHFRSLDRETAVTLHFRSIATRPAAFVGFVAADGTLWQVTAVEPR